jgi:hypothetical protein
VLLSDLIPARSTNCTERGVVTDAEYQKLRARLRQAST